MNVCVCVRGVGVRIGCSVQQFKSFIWFWLKYGSEFNVENIKHNSNIFLIPEILNASFGVLK